MEHRRQETNIETRFSVMPETQATVVEGTRTIRGYGIVFNKESEVLQINGRRFREIIRPEAVTGVNMGQMLSMHNHKSERLLGNTRSGTMRTGVDEIGVWYETDLPDSPTGQDVLVSVARRDTQGSSFQFDITEKGDKWTARGGIALREVIQFNGVYEMGPVSEPAYPDTTINQKSLRSLEEMSDMEDIADQADDAEPVGTWELGYMVDNAAYALYQANSTIERLNGWIRNYGYWAEEGGDQRPLFTRLLNDCTTAKTALLNLINSHADAVKALNGAENRSIPEPETNFQALADDDEYAFQQMQLA